MPRREIEHVLIVEDNASLQRSLQRTLGKRFAHVALALNCEEAAQAMREQPPDLIVLDFELPDGNAFTVLDAARACPTMPVVVSMSGAANSGETFELAKRGVRAFLPKPLTTEALETAIDSALGDPPDLSVQFRSMVGLRAVKDVEEEVRATMVDEALARSDGNKRAAARLLSISRQLLQYILRQSDR